MKPSIESALLTFAVGCLALAAFTGGSSFGRFEERGDAVAAGVAEWTYRTNSVGQLVQDGFRYKTNFVKGAQ